MALAVTQAIQVLLQVVKEAGSDFYWIKVQAFSLYSGIERQRIKCVRLLLPG